MRLGRNLSISSKALVRHPVRTGLAVSGTGVGVAAVLVMVAIGEGARAELVDRVNALGGNLLLVAATQIEPAVGRPGGPALAQTLVPSDATAIVREVPDVEAAAPSIDAPREVTYGRLSLSTSVRAVSPDYERVRNFRTARGRYFTRAEAMDRARVTVLGDRVARTLFGGSDPVGELVRVGRIPFEVIGVLEPRGASAEGGRDEDDQILIPLETGLRRVFNADYVTLLYVKVRDDAPLDRAEARISSLLRERHEVARRAGGDDFRVENQRLVVEASRRTSDTFRRVITGLAAVALVVGGVGTMSVMSLSIRERRSEIGLRVAIGAKRREVRSQFVSEALMLGGAGGLGGLLVGSAVAGAVGRLTAWRTEVSGPAIAIAIVAALAVSLVFGVGPARRAAALDPVDSLRA